MIKSATFYRITSALPQADEHLQASLQQDHDFAPCQPSQATSSGWVPPRGEDHGPLIEIVNGQWIMKLMTETKKVPADVINRKVKEHCAELEKLYGRKPGKKEAREIREDILLTLLPAAFPTQTSTLVWIDPESKLLVIDTASQARADEVATWLVKCLPGLALGMVNTAQSPATQMTAWLATQEDPICFTVDRDCELKASDESKARVAYSKHALDIPEVQQHLAAGMIPAKLAMTWEDRVSFVLTESLALKKIEFLGNTIDVGMALDNDAFDANVAIMTGELRTLIPNLLNALGGEVGA